MPGAEHGENTAVEDLLDRIGTGLDKLAGRTVRLMEVCGTHTMSIGRSGLRYLLPDELKLISGPGCPVCVTHTGYVDAAIELARREDVIITTFGDMLRVPGTSQTLEQLSGEGADVRVVYSPMKTLDVAAEHPGKTVVFLGVGFETTTPADATLILRAHEGGVKNVVVLSAHKLIPPALRVLAIDPELMIDGFILPGHVSVVIGEEPYGFVAEEFGRPCVITGFEPMDVLEGVAMLVEQIASGEAKVQNQYHRVVRPEGNPVARERIDEVFEVADVSWRGLGLLPGSGLTIREKYSDYDAEVRFGLVVALDEPETGCMCGDVLKGKIAPSECPLFAGTCTPENPVGACMVSSEGACAATFRFDGR